MVTYGLYMYARKDGQALILGSRAILALWGAIPLLVSFKYVLFDDNEWRGILQ